MLQCVEHGFPNKPTALAYDPYLRLLAVGTKYGGLRMYPFFFHECLSPLEMYNCCAYFDIGANLVFCCEIGNLQEFL